MPSRERLLLLPVVLVLALIMLDAVVSVRAIAALRQDHDAVTQAHELLATLERVRTTAQGVVLNQRGYALTGDAAYLNAYREDAATLPLLLHRLDTLAVEGSGDLAPKVQRGTDELREAVRAHLAEQAGTVALRRRGGADAALTHIRGGRGYALLLAVYRATAEIEEEARRGLARSGTAVARSAARATFASVLTTGIALLLTALTFGLGLGAVRRREAEVKTHAEHAAELAARVAERTAELERSNRELDQFAYVASHDLKAPLRGIENLATWIVEDAEHVLPEPSKRHLGLLRGRVQRLEGLLESLLAYSRAGRLTGFAERVDSAALVREAVELLDPPDGFTVEVDEALPALVTYRAPLALVFRNLLANAVKHAGPDGGRIRVSARALAGTAGGTAADADAFVEFGVQDDGPGIPPQYHDRIFGLFQTLRPRDEVEGSGMGLAVVKKTVESLGGAIRVESTPGAGAAFYFTWPRRV